VGVVMRYPTYEMVQSLGISNKTERERNFDVVVKCIEKIYDDKSVYEAKDCSFKEVVDFVEGLTQNSFAKIMRFFENMPRMKHEVRYECPSCKHQGTMVLTGLQDFFT
jgi:hypothetical protein